MKIKEKWDFSEVTAIIDGVFSCSDCDLRVHRRFFDRNISKVGEVVGRMDRNSL